MVEAESRSSLGEGLGMAIPDLRGIPTDLDFTTKLAQRIGGLSITFALFEFGLNSIIAVIFKSMDGAQAEPQIPIQLNRCRQYIRKAVKKLPALAPYKAELLAIEAEAERIGNIRHDIIHGFIGSYEATSERLTFVKSQPDLETKQIHIVTLREISIPTLDHTINAAADLAGRTTKLLKRLVETHMTEDARKEVFSEVRGKGLAPFKIPEK
jgi:hypothetical protein